MSQSLAKNHRCGSLWHLPGLQESFESIGIYPEVEFLLPVPTNLHDIGPIGGQVLRPSRGPHIINGLSLNFRNLASNSDDGFAKL